MSEVLRNVLLLIAGVVFLAVPLPSLGLAYLGMTCRLADASEEINRNGGWFFLLIAFVASTPLAYLILWKPRNSSPNSTPPDGA